MQQVGSGGPWSWGALDGQEDRLRLALDRLKSIVLHLVILDIEVKVGFLFIVYVFRGTFFS